MISLEKGLFDPNNRARKRIANYGSFLKQLDIVVLGTKPYNEDITPNVHVTSTNSSSRWWYVFDALRFIWKTRKTPYDVVVSQDINEMGLIAYIAARLHKAAFAPNDVGYFFHGNYFAKESFGNKLRTILGHWLLKKTDAIRVMSKRSEGILINEYRIPPEAIICYPFDVDRQFFKEAPPLSDEEKQLVHDHPYFLIPARFVPIKRIDLAIHAFAEVAKDHPDPLLILVGQGPLKNNFERLIEKLHLQNRVRMVPWTQAMATWYQNALATVISSDREGYAMTALESLICHTPVIMTDVGCAHEVVRDKENGYVVPVGDVPAITNAMIKILTKTDPVKAQADRFTYTPPVRETREFIQLAVERKRLKR